MQDPPSIFINFGMTINIYNLSLCDSLEEIHKKNHKQDAIITFVSQWKNPFNQDPVTIENVIKIRLEKLTIYIKSTNG